MKKIVRSIAIASIILSFSSSSIFALEEKNRIKYQTICEYFKTTHKKRKV